MIDADATHQLSPVPARSFVHSVLLAPRPAAEAVVQHARQHIHHAWVQCAPSPIIVRPASDAGWRFMHDWLPANQAGPGRCGQPLHLICTKHGPSLSHLIRQSTQRGRARTPGLLHHWLASLTSAHHPPTPTVTDDSPSAHGMHGQGPRPPALHAHPPSHLITRQSTLMVVGPPFLEALTHRFPQH